MPKPKLIIYPDEFSLYFIGLRLQQLWQLFLRGENNILDSRGWLSQIHYETCGRWLTSARYEALGLSALPKAIGRSISSQFNDLNERFGMACKDFLDVAHCSVGGRAVQRDRRMGSRRRTRVQSRRRSVCGQVAIGQRMMLTGEVLDTIDLFRSALSRSEREVAWFELGVNAPAVDGAERDKPPLGAKDWLDTLQIGWRDLVGNPTPELRSQIPRGFDRWSRLEAGIQHLQRVAEYVCSILDQPFLPTLQQTAILKALEDTAMNSEALGFAINDRRGPFARKGGRDHLLELRVRKKVAWDPIHGYYRPDRPPANR
jgi:hypothetical protein